MHLAPLISDLAVILGLAGIVSLIFQRIKQPVVLGYLAAGMIVGPHTPPYTFISDLPNIKIWAELGVIFLMFSLGLEFSFRKLARVGGTASITASFEVILMVSLGFIVGHFLLGWKTMDALFLGAMIAISSTTIIIRSLDELGLKTKKFAEVVFGILIVEDLYAILLLVALSTIASSDHFSGLQLIGAAGKLAFIVGSWFIVGYFLVPRFIKQVARYGTDEMLTILPISLCLLLVAVAAHFEYSVALGAFIMGSIIAETDVANRIEHLITPLKNVFAAVFFVSVGMLIDPQMFAVHWSTILIISVVTIAGKFIGASLGSLLSGQTVKTSTQVGLTVSQIGEFSFIIAGLGTTLGVTSDFLYPIGVAVSLVTTLVNPYLLKPSAQIADWIESHLPESIRLNLAQYASRRQAKQANQSGKKEYYIRVVKWLVNGLVITIAFVSASQYLSPMIDNMIEGERWQNVIAWFAAITIASPFIWAMFTFSRILTLIWVAALSLQFFTMKSTFLLLGIVLIGFFLLFYRKLEASYGWFEKGFLSTFEPKEKDAHSHAMASLAPWDAHLIKIKVHPNAAFAGKRLMDVELRNKFGLNVVAIQRGLQSIVAPKPEERLYPKDELLVLSTDEQIETVRPFLEGPHADTSHYQGISNYQMRSFLIQEGSPLAQGVSIRNSGIRENFGAIVVGIERNQNRVMNPNSDLTLQAGDVLWLVGSQQALSAFQSS